MVFENFDKARCCLSAGINILFCDWQKDISDGHDEVIIYLSAVGDVHLVTRMAARVLQFLNNQTATISEIKDFYNSQLQIDDEQITAEELLSGYVVPFQQLGIIQVEN